MSVVARISCGGTNPSDAPEVLMADGYGVSRKVSFSSFIKELSLLKERMFGRAKSLI